MMVNRKILDRLAAQGCSVPGCDHKNHLEEFFFHSKCHTGASTDVIPIKDGLRFLCHVCKKKIVDVATEAVGKLAKECHPEAGFESSYMSRKGKVKLSCLECKTFVLEAAVSYE